MREVHFPSDGFMMSNMQESRLLLCSCSKRFCCLTVSPFVSAGQSVSEDPTPHLFFFAKLAISTTWPRTPCLQKRTPLSSFDLRIRSAGARGAALETACETTQRNPEIMQGVFVARSGDDEETLLVERRLQRELEDFINKVLKDAWVVPLERIKQTNNNNKNQKVKWCKSPLVSWAVFCFSPLCFYLVVLNILFVNFYFITCISTTHKLKRSKRKIPLFQWLRVIDVQTY